jgi:nitroreductase
MDAIAAIRSRRSTRAFEDRPLDRQLVTALIEDATHAPFTPIAKRGAWLFTVIEGRDKLAEVGERALDFARANRPQLAGYEWTERSDFSVFHGAPVAIVISGRHELPVALEECTRAGQILDIAANARGVGICWVGAPMMWLRDDAARNELQIPDGWVPYAAFALGYAAAGQPPSTTERPPLDIRWQ